REYARRSNVILSTSVESESFAFECVEWVMRNEGHRRHVKKNMFENWVTVSSKCKSQTFQVLNHARVIHLKSVIRNAMVDPMNSCTLVFMSRKQLSDAHRTMRLPIHEKFDEFRAERSEPSPSWKRVGFF